MKDTSDLPEQLRELLRSEREAEAVSPALRARLASRLTTSLGVSVPHDPRALEASPTNGLGNNVGSSALHWLSQKPIVAALLFTAGASLGSLGTLGVQSLRSRAPVTVPAPVTSPPPAAAATNAPPAAASPSAEPASNAGAAPLPAARERAAASRDHTTGNATLTDLRAEQLLVDQARSALARDRALDALVALQTHLRRFPAGQLAEERASLYVVALARAGRRAEAERAARQFRIRYPSSLFRAMVDQALY
jgi:hypothetical protein